MKKYLMLIFIATAIAQAFVPLKMIYDSEMTVKHGTEYKFKTAPIDPSDPFRGKYITLSFDFATLYSADSTWMPSDEIYVRLVNDSDGFAKVAAIAREKPEGENNYFVTTVNYHYNNNLNIAVPFTRFYMEEGKAYEAETGYVNYSTNQNATPAYALVAIKDGNAVLKNVYLDGLPIKEYVLRQRTIQK